ncbi:GAK system XXXCH domain-containing protein [Desulfovibrio inopinatus]|uniref:GAK system XXXCH domain-containing protein n=1 Tax=Desulfovibrio inopinatus TaxID=102109 RepID=UPI00041FF7B6|nr:GAK system XXXCH domain-containing protein [Desulfovibrio inopinatus]
MYLAPKQKYEALVKTTELGEFLANVAETVKAGKLIFNEQDVPLEGFSSLKMSVKNMGESSLVKIKLKYQKTDDDGVFVQEGGTTEATSSSGRPKYKSLKKKMKNEWKTIRLSLQNGQLPNPAIASVFIEESRLMTTYPGKGDEYYTAFNTATDAFEKAINENDLEAARIAMSELGRLKRECHDRYA